MGRTSLGNPMRFNPLLDEMKYRLLAAMRRRAMGDRFAGIVVPVDDLIGQRVMATGAFERTQFEGIDRMLDEPSFAGVAIDRDGLFVDVGANIGLFSIAYAGRFPAVLAVEANPDTHAVLKANMGLRRITNVVTACEAASDGHRRGRIHVPTNGNLGWATLDATHHDIPVEATDVACRPLDALVAEHGGGRRVGLVKIDVEGHELSVLKGAEEVLRRDRPVILFEVLDARQGRACGEFLEGLGYGRFWTFRRAGRGRLGRLVKSLAGKLDVLAVPLRVEDFHHAALVCAAPGG